LPAPIPSHYVCGTQNYPAPFIPEFRPLIVMRRFCRINDTIHIARAIQLGLNSPQARLHNKGAYIYLTDKLFKPLNINCVSGRSSASRLRH